MPINPEEASTISVGQLAPAAWAMADMLPHEVNAFLKKGSVQGLADLIKDYIGTASSLAFNPTTVPDGGTLPTTSTSEWLLVGKGTFNNVGGLPEITTTEELNALTSNGTYWSLAVQIPINVELAGIVQTIRSGFTTTTPSENAVSDALALKADIRDIPDISGKENTSNKQNSLTSDGTGVKFPTVDAVNLAISSVSNFPKRQFTADGIQTTFDLMTTVLANMVFWNGAPLDDADWSQSSNILTLTFTPGAGTIIKPI